MKWGVFTGIECIVSLWFLYNVFFLGLVISLLAEENTLWYFPFLDIVAVFEILILLLLWDEISSWKYLLLEYLIYSLVGFGNILLKNHEG